ncbi:MAG: galactitol-1-phosphate 5-dehydrogenase [Clostridia bacterium]|nr:galactitol-1-phosphate 5-dehydrogenase [Clostridia bacterium]
MNYIAMPLVKSGITTTFKKENRQFMPPEADEVTLRVRACGVCGSDIARWRGDAYHYPLVIGHEFAGEVIDDPTGEWTGKRAVVFPLIPCGECDSCKREAYAMCEHYDYYGSRRDGAFQELLNVKRENLIEIPDTVSYEAAAMCEPCAVALCAIEKAKTVAGKTVAIYGAGTIGLILVKLALIKGASAVYVYEPDARKLVLAEECGAMAMTDDVRADVFIDACGREAALTDMLTRAKPSAELVLMGNPAGDMHLPRAVYWKILRGELTLYGTWNSRFSTKHNDWQAALALMSNGAFMPETLITHRFPLDEAEAALTAMADRDTFSVKVMLVNKELL